MVSCSFEFENFDANIPSPTLTLSWQSKTWKQGLTTDGERFFVGVVGDDSRVEGSKLDLAQLFDWGVHLTAAPLGRRGHPATTVAVLAD